MRALVLIGGHSSEVINKSALHIPWVGTKIMAVHVVVKSASKLPKLDRFSKVDPYCDLTFHEEKSTTKTISNDQSPEWNETFKWTLEVVPGSDEAVEVEIMDHETLGKNRPIVKGVIPLATALEQGSDSQEVSLTSPEGDALESKLFVDVKYRVPVSESLKKDLNEAKKKIEELEELLKKLKAEAAEKEQELTAQIESLTSELEALKSTVDQKETELSQSKEENESLKAKLSEAETKIRQLGGDSAGPSVSTDDPDKELKAQNQSLKEEVTALKRQVAELQSKRDQEPVSEREPLIPENQQQQGGGQRSGCCVLL